MPGANYPKTASTALPDPATTRIGREIAVLEHTHLETSGFQLLPLGRQSLRRRIELADASERTLDLQYFSIENDSSGKLLMNSVLRAADRGVRVRMLIDDFEDRPANAQLAALAAHPGIEIRIFNPYFLRGFFDVLRSGEFVLASRRLNSRMHNKLFIVDNAAAILGGRNIGDEYFQASKDLERFDFDVFTVGPVVPELSRSFDLYWNCDLAVPVEALRLMKPDAAALEKYRAELAKNRADAEASDNRPPSERSVAAATDMLVEKSFTWAPAKVLYDYPEKTRVEDGEQRGPLLRHRLVDALDTVDTDLRVVSPYLVPGDGGMHILEGLRSRNVRVRILTNSLASTDMPIAHVGYRHYRTKMLEDGIELYEARPVLGDPDGAGEHLKSPSSGQLAIHAKVFVLDEQRVFVGSMNFDYRSLRLNTELGILIDSPELAQKVAARFDAMAQPANCYIPTLEGNGAARTLVWKTEENGKPAELTAEPSGDLLRGLQNDLLTLLPIDDLL